MMSGVVSKYCVDNMICLEDGDQSVGEFRLAGLLASHLVGQVLDEAYIIANAAKESGENVVELTYPNMQLGPYNSQPWRYWTMVKNLRNGKLTEPDLIEPKEDSIAPSSHTITLTMDENMGELVNNLVTSTPQKHGTDNGDDAIKNEVTLIGQGDGDVIPPHSDSSYNFINSMFDMSEVKKSFCENNELVDIIQIKEPAIDASEQIFQAITEIIDSYVNIAFSMTAAGDDLNPFRQMTDNNIEDVKTEEYPEYSLWTGMFGIDPNNLAFCVEVDENVNSFLPKKETTAIITQQQSVLNIMNQSVEAYLTLNRDYDTYSDEDGDPILQDPKSLADLQEIDLLTADVSEQNLAIDSRRSDLEDAKKKKAESPSTSGMTFGSKKSLVRRCRVHGAKLLQCLRGWWKRRTPRRKESHRPGVGYLTPAARRRGLSLDQRELCDQSTSSVPWKFHTLSEALVNSTRWNEYTFETNPHCRNT